MPSRTALPLDGYPAEPLGSETAKVKASEFKCDSVYKRHILCLVQVEAFIIYIYYHES